MQAPEILRVSEFQIEKLNSHRQFPPAADVGGFLYCVSNARRAVSSFGRTQDRISGLGMDNTVGFDYNTDKVPTG